MASPVTQAAIARLGIQVALPSRGDIARGLQWMPSMLEGIFKRVNQASYGTAVQAANDQQKLVDQMMNNEIKGEKARGTFIENAEKESRTRSLTQFKKHSKMAGNIARDAVTNLTANKRISNYAQNMGVKDRNMQTDINNILRERTRLFDRIAGLSKYYHDLEAPKRKQLIQDLKDELQFRRNNWLEWQKFGQQQAIFYRRSQGMAFAKKEGIDPKEALQVIADETM